MLQARARDPESQPSIGPVRLDPVATRSFHLPRRSVNLKIPGTPTNFLDKGGRVTARYLLVLFDSAYLIALTAWVGSILFFSFGVAPIIFKVLGAEAGARFVRSLFPRYYLWGAISGAIALPSMVAVPLCFPEFRGPMIGVQALAIIGCTLIMLYAGNSLTPEINRARDAGPSGHPRFEQLHRRSVRLNALVLVVGLGLLVGFATRLAPRTSGILEKTPAERLLLRRGSQPGDAAGGNQVWPASGLARPGRAGRGRTRHRRRDGRGNRRDLRSEAASRRRSGQASRAGRREHHQTLKAAPPPGSAAMPGLPRPARSGEPGVN